MRSLLPFLVAGITTGSLYGLTGLGLVLTYRTSGVFNFAHGAVAAAAAYLFFRLHYDGGVPWPLALLAAVAVVGAGGGALLERLAAGLAGARAASLIVATVGLLLAVQGLLYVRFGLLTRDFPAFLPTDGIVISGVHVTYAQMITVAVSVTGAAGLYWFLRASRLGITMRAVVDSPELLGLAGTSPRRVRTIAWIIGSSFAALSGILVAPITGLDAALLTLLVVQGFGAVALGRFASLPLTFAGGLAVGIAASVATKYVANNLVLSGLPNSIPFLVLIGVLLLTPSARLPRDIGRPGGWSRGPALLNPAVRTAGLAGGAAVLLLIPHVVGSRLPVYLSGLTLALAFLSLSLLVRTSGQISLCHGAFLAVGATTFSHLTVGAGFPWLVALAGAGLVALPVGVVLALPAIRLSGIYLALATFGFGLLVQGVAYNSGFMFGRQASLSAPRPQIGFVDGTNDTTFYYIVLAIVAACTGAIVAVTRGRLGRLLRALADSPPALTTNGLSVNVTRVLVFSLSALFAGVAGGLFISQAGAVSRESAFGPFQSLTWLAVLVICGRGTIVPSFLAAALLAVTPSYVSGLTPEWQVAIFGMASVVAAIRLEHPIALDRVTTLAAASEWRRSRSPVLARMHRSAAAHRGADCATAGISEYNLG